MKYLKDTLSTIAVNRVCTCPGNPGKSRDFILSFSRTEKSWKRPLVLESSGDLLNPTKCSKFQLSNLFTVAIKPNYLSL